MRIDESEPPTYFFSEMRLSVSVLLYIAAIVDCVVQRSPSTAAPSLSRESGPGMRTCELVLAEYQSVDAAVEAANLAPACDIFVYSKSESCVLVLQRLPHASCTAASLGRNL